MSKKQINNKKIAKFNLNIFEVMEKFKNNILINEKNYEVIL
jgi:hypothetical protein